MAAHFLAVRGFNRVFQLQGGIEAWEHRTAASPPELHLQFIRGDESAIEAATIACRFETGLEQFYRTAVETSRIAEVRDLLEKLSGLRKATSGTFCGCSNRSGVTDLRGRPCAT